MSVAVPTDLLSIERTFEMDLGCADAAKVLGAIFPPRREDPDGALALTSMEVLANQMLRAQTAARSECGQRRRWWLEGFAVGFAQAAITTLRDAAELEEMTVQARLDDMEANVAPKLTADQQPANRIAFELCRSVDSADAVALAWALEAVWACEDADIVSMLDRYRRVLIATINLSCAAWQLLLLLRTDDA